MSAITTSDGTEIYYVDWGAGPPMSLSHGWPLSASPRRTKTKSTPTCWPCHKDNQMIPAKGEPS
jgi:hypothetical protein